jgi:ectoine hydroxylase-related dioxygenase (phytanoyl-CoA dioxygenase family)
MSDWQANYRLDACMDELARLGLMQHVGELEAKGYTVVPPEKLAPPEFTDRLAEAVLRVAEQRTGVKADLNTGASHGHIERERVRLGDGPDTDWHWHLVFEDRVFEEALLNETVRALVIYLLGEHAKLSVDGAILKGPTEGSNAGPSGMHTDSYGVPAPVPPYAQVCNATWTLTDYTRDGGCTRFVPGSHRFGRQPLNPEEALSQATPAEAAKGSLVIWHGNTWHTRSNPRVIPGMRVCYTMLFCRQYMMPQQLYNLVTPEAAVARNPPAFATLMGLNDPYGVHGQLGNYHRNYLTGYANSTRGKSLFE